MKKTFLLLAVLSVGACRSFNKLSNQNLALSYDYRETYLHPETALYHPDDSTAVLYLRIHHSELLTQKKENGQPAVSVRVAWAVFADYDAKVPADSGSRLFPDPAMTEDHYVFQIGLSAPLPEFILELQVTDLNRKKGTVLFLESDKRSAQSSQRFVLIGKTSHTPLFRNYVRGPEAFRLYGAALTDRLMQVRCYFRKFPVAAPPFSSRFPVQFDYRPDSTYSVDVNSETAISLPRRGIYHFQYDTTVKSGITVFRFEEDFPKVTEADALVESLRYLTTNEEFTRLTSSPDQKEAVDAFWIELAGNRERARTLIRRYYTRIQEANRLFSSYLEGWKTDRGMIYTIMGAPTSVFRTAETEEWTYGNYNDASAVSFTFEKIYNPFCMNDYILRRSGFYEEIWYRMVDRWRQGAAVND